MARREAVIGVAAAIFGFAVGIALLPVWLRKPAPNQLPSFATRVGIDAGASYHFLLGLVLLTILAPVVTTPLRQQLSQARTWAFVTATVALSFSLWTALAQENVLWVALPALTVALVCHRMGAIAEHFSRSDVVLLPTSLCVFMAITDLAPNASLGKRVIVSSMACLAVRLALPMIGARRGLRPGHCFVATPIALLLQSHYNGDHQRHFGWPPLLIALGAPFLFRLVRSTPLVRRRWRLSTALLIYPVTILCYASATSTLAAEGKPRGDLFEDAHNLAVASDMLRGERPYRDTIPAHGLIQDGLLDYLILRTGRQTAGRVLQIHGVLGGIISVAGYAVGTAATGSPDAGLLAYFFGAAIGTSGGGLRGAPAFFALALLAYGVRRRSRRCFAYAGGMLVVAAFTSIDFAAYAAIALIVAIARMPSGGRSSAVRSAAIGIGGAGAAATIALSAAGIGTAFVHSTLFEVARLGPVYSLTPFSAPEALRAHRFPPELLATVFDRSAFPILFWSFNLIAVAAGLRYRHRRTPLVPHVDALFVLGAFVIAAGLSYAERQHMYAQLLAGPVIITALTLVVARRTSFRRFAAAVLIGTTMAVAQPTAFLSVIDMLRHDHGPLAPDLTEIPEIPRARGALYRSGDAAVIRSAYKYVSALQPDDTFFDFTNRGALYFLLDRDCPIRQVEVAFYEPERLQREVINRLRGNPHVRAALIPRHDDVSVTVDEVPNEVRAPVVWQYLQENFRPDFAEGDVIFWRRIER
ncbi:MAG TPA: hypothetical protein VLV86_25370 [Vicinamibacterales bacterium]|nr:hypothetical protein [Vicinamibacterales bacterium]